jgi:PAS domain S-box-containing protein
MVPVLIAGLVATMMVYRLARGREAARAEVAFTGLADSEATTVEKRIAVSLESLYALRSFFHGSQYVTADEFQSFASELRERHEILQALEWIPTVAESERARYESAARESGIIDYEIRELDENGSLVRAAPREFYYPVRYLDPLSNQRMALGFDLASEENRRSTLRRAAAELKPIISRPLNPVQGGKGTVSFIAGLPMERFAADHPPAYIAGSFLLALLSFENSTMFSDCSDDSDFAYIRLLARDGNAWVPLLRWARETANHEAERTEMVAIRLIEFGGQVWRLELSPTKEFVEASRTLMPAILAAGTAGLWVILIAGGFLQLRLSQEVSRRRHARILDSVLASVDEGIVVAGPDGRLLFYNESARRFVGRVDDSIPISDWPARVGAFSPDGKTLFSPTQLPLVRAIHGESVPPTEVFVKNPATPQGAWVTVTGKPLFDETGNRKGGVVIIRDRTEEKRAQATVDRLAQAVESTADPVLITDRDGTIEYVNAAFQNVTGFAREDALGKKPRILKSGKHEASFYEEMWQCLLDGNDHKCTVINRAKSGRLFTAEETITPMRDAGGEITHFVAVLKDMTEILRRREQEVELRVAAQVQKKLYPAKAPLRKGWDIAGIVLPADETCGDYYDFIDMDNGALALVVGDVCGHGLGAALVMSEVRALLRATSALVSDPADIVKRVNRALNVDLEDHFFVTMILATLDTDSGALQWINAGHPSGYVVDAEGELKAEMRSQIVPLGILPGYSAVVSHETVLKPGDVALLVTDGVTEWGENVGEPFGPERVLEFLREWRHLPAAEMATRLMEVLREFSDVEQSDDVTLIVCKAC